MSNDKIASKFFVEDSNEVVKTPVVSKVKPAFAKKTYVIAGADKFTEIFNKEEEKKKAIDNLNFLTSLSVEEFTFLKKYEEIKGIKNSTHNFKTDYVREAEKRIWCPKDIHDEKKTIDEITALEPDVLIIDNTTEIGKKEESIWTVLRVFCSSAEYNQAPGRFIKFMMVDRITNKCLGICSVASDVISISDRDKYIGWSQEDKLKHGMLEHSAIGTTIVPTQPLGSNFLGGKLVAALVTSSKVRDTWKKYGTTLVGMTTTSLYGSFSMYNSLKWWKPVGASKGKIPIKFSEDSYQAWHNWLKQHRADEYNKKMTQKEGISGPVTGAKMRVLSMIFDELGVKQSDYVHGFERGVYYSCFYENSRDFLCRKITEDKLVMKPLFKDDIKAIVDWWKPKAIERYKKLKSEGRLNSEKLFYADMQNMTYEEAKSKYFNEVGR